jgi:hypothetical protein
MKRYKILSTVIACMLVLIGMIILLNTDTHHKTAHASIIPAMAHSPSHDTLPPKLAPLPITLPVAQFVGTPPNLAGIPKLERLQETDHPPFLAPKGAVNIAWGKRVKSSVHDPIMGELDWVTDGDKEATGGSQVELDPFTQSITIDLEQQHEIYAILFWHDHKQAQVYSDVVVQVSNDPDFIFDVKTLFNNDHDNSSQQGIGMDKHYVETHYGKLIDAKGIAARYVRLYSNGNNANDQNHYLEVEVFGVPVLAE